MAGHMAYDLLMKTVIIGDSGVGKSSLLYRYSDNDWSPIYVATIGVDFKMDMFETQGKIVKLQMWDTAGQERFKTICAAYYRGAHSVMLVYDVTNRETFDNVKKWMAEVEHYARPNLPMILVGNKCDRVSDRVVSADEADIFAEKHGMEHVEVSAKSAANVHEAFRKLVDKALEQRVEIVKDTEERKARIIRLQEQASRAEAPTCMERFRKLLPFM
ncbi:Ras-like GTP-binding protein YPT1 [Diplonema papillatum]|nr:Ras-like GTP-binding protein YPT1 [Diplonema papillatum]